MAVGHSDDVDAVAAVQVAIDECQLALGDAHPQAGLLFCGADAFSPDLIGIVRAAFPGIKVAGTTSSAEISSVNGYQEDSISLAVFASDSVEFGTGVGHGLGQDRDAACEAAV